MSEIRKLDDVSREQKLKEVSGNVVLSDSLATFLYLLMRDHLPAGKVELLIQAVIEGAEKITFHNGYLAQYASNLADELRDGRFKALVEALDAAFTDHTRTGTPTKVPTEGADVPATLELTTEATTVIEKAYESLTEEARKQAELVLETGESEEVKELTEKMEGAFDTATEITDEIEQVALKLKEQIAKNAIELPTVNFDENDLNNPFSPASLRKKAEEAKPQETQLQKRQREMVVEPNKEFNETVKEQAINSALLAIEKLKTLVPNETVVEIAKVLRDEVEHELTVNKKVQEIKDNQVLETEPSAPKPTGVFRRVNTNVDETTVDNVIQTSSPLVGMITEHLNKPANKPSVNSFSRGDPELELDEQKIVFVERTDDGREPSTQE